MTKLPKIFAIVVENKGGVGKSLIAQIVAETLRDLDDNKIPRNRVLMMDSDLITKSTLRTDTSTVPVDFSRPESLGFIGEAALDLFKGEYDAVVLDTAAGEEARIEDILIYLSKIFARQPDAEIVVFRPITLSSLVQENAISFALDSIPRGIRTIFVRNLGQGRLDSDFSAWRQNPERKRALEMGAGECALDNAGTQYADEANSYGLSIAAAALGRFDLALDGMSERASRVFNTRIQIFLSEWIGNQVERFRKTIIEVIQRVSPNS